MRRLVAGIDVGGTFRPAAGKGRGQPARPLAKVPSTTEVAVETAARGLSDVGCEALVIHFLHSCANPAHKRRIGEIAARLWPNGYVTLRHALLSEFREFERDTTALVNAASAPAAARSPGSTRRGCCGSARKAPAPRLARSATGAAVCVPPSPTPTLCWAASTPPA